MGLKNARRINYLLVFSVSLIVTFSKASVNEISPKDVPCEQGWYFFNEKCYKIFPVGTDKDLNWLDSEDSCISKGGNLASIHSSDLQDFLTLFLLSKTKSSVWIGLNDRAAERVFKWVDGSLSNYTNWNAGEPSKSFTEEDCVEMRYTTSNDAGTWNDVPCSSLKPYICQVDKKNETNLPDPRFCSVEDGGGWKYLNSCYHIVKEEKSWEDAEKYCEEKYKGFLVSILEDNAEVFLNYIMKLSNVSGNIWIGIKMGNYSKQKWTSGWHVTNKKFNQERLNFSEGTCVMKTTWNSWGVAPCHNKYAFICEKMKSNVPVLQRPPSEDWKCPDSGKKWLDLGGHSCYYIEVKSQRTWFEANYECGKEGGTLVTFHSEIETNLLHPHVLDTEERLLIGIARKFDNKNDFEWADGTQVIYKNWHKGEPSSTDEKCGELGTESMKWNDLPCNIKKGYICKAKKIFSWAKFNPNSTSNSSSNQPLIQQNSTSAVSKNLNIHSSGISMGIVAGIALSTLLVGLLVGVIVYHYRDYWMIYCTKTEKNSYSSVEPSSVCHVSEKMIWKPEEEGLHT